MTNLNTSSIVTLSVIFSLAVVYSIGYFGTKLSNDHGSDVRTVWYIFSLASICTFIAASWASNVGSIDSSGSFQGSSGKFIESLLVFMLDLNTDIMLCVALFTVIVIPQITSYLLSGLFGCASSPILIGRALSFFVWSTVKSLVVVSGVLLTIAIYGAAKGWVNWDLKGVGSLSITSLTTLAMSFFCLFIYRDIGSTMALPVSHREQRIKNCLIPLQNWFTRKNKLNCTHAINTPATAPK